MNSSEENQFIGNAGTLKSNKEELRLHLSESDDSFSNRNIIRRAKLMNSSHFVCIVMTATLLVTVCGIVLLVQIIERSRQ
ncbi:Protein CBG04037 [Caenorhabditis briggsae]|uniref:Uncharacterized protein n=2 Tax=Caenorhabditis briggsae TaxID=6238 RepID=A0AAE9DZ63_CAEBR|nr:Protein CBG04037 [Caenorhabditis briggsae]ULU10487.1 hypothetical protein L3Y34_014640 [Caenorhabditis briggsae]UMM11415.1 hypothetical protein L5515_000716 [Caenorhabditis briggsae]CAP24830.2 Protein CBG04037 [Caenorhabditis briggsae]